MMGDLYAVARAQRLERELERFHPRPVVRIRFLVAFLVAIGVAIGALIR